MAAKTIGVTGGTGFVGRHIISRLTALGHSVVVFSRQPQVGKGDIRYALWRPHVAQIDTASLQDIDAMVHLAGAGVADKRWPPKRKEEIRKSRVEATYFLLQALQAWAPQCSTFVAASATGYYGPDRNGLIPFTEDAPAYHDFLAEVCTAWEAASLSASEKYRTVILRTGIVLGKDGGAYPQLAAPMRFGIMPILGNGEQMVSWIHVDDLAQLYIEATLNNKYDGIYNAVAPQPVTHSLLMHTIAKAKGGIKIPAPVPALALRLLIGEASVEVLKSCTVSSDKAAHAGFVFRYQTIVEAVASINRGL